MTDKVFCHDRGLCAVVYSVEVAIRFDKSYDRSIRLSSVRVMNMGTEEQ